jgi:hypothetical protein
VAATRVALSKRVFPDGGGRSVKGSTTSAQSDAAMGDKGSASST